MAASVVKNYVYNTILNGLNLLFPLITFPYVNRILGPEGLGKIDFVSAYMALFLVVATLGIPMYGMREVARVRTDPQELKRIFSELFVLNFISTMAAVVLYSVSYFAIPKFHEETGLFLVIGITIFLNLFNVDWLFQGLEEYKFIALRSIAVKIVSLVAIFLMVQRQGDYLVYASITVVATTAASVWNLGVLRRYTSFSLKNINILRHWKGISAVSLLVFISTIGTKADKNILGFLLGPETVGFYGVSDKIVLLGLSLTASLATVLIPRMAHYHSMGQETAFREAIVKSFRYIVLISLPMTVGMVFCAQELVMIFSGESFLPAVPTIMVAGVNILVLGIAHITGLQLLYSIGRENHYIISVGAGITVMVLLGIPLSLSFRNTGMAWAVLCGNIVQVLVQIYFSRIFLQESHVLSKLKKYLVASFGVWMVLLLVGVLPESDPPVSLGLKVVLSALVYFGMLLGMKDELLNEFLLKIRETFLKTNTREKTV